MSSIVIVANRALGERSLVDWMVARDRSGVVQFRLVVPVRVPGPWDLGEGLAGFVPMELLDADGYLAPPRARTVGFVGELRMLGLDVTGSVHAGDAMRVLEEVLRDERVDELVVAPAAAAVSRLLGIDLARRLRRRWPMPVHEVGLRPQCAAA